MDAPETCSLCGQRLHRIHHPVAHEGALTWNAQVRTCPHNLYGADRYADRRHDEWHLGEHGWVKREA